MATGPHLHYEFRFKGVQRDPLKVAMPTANPVSPRQMSAFYEYTKSPMARLDALRGTSLAFLD
jgi:murein DD-endopeptidase MepM/ murein hydrolase activator NlpD